MVRSVEQLATKTEFTGEKDKSVIVPVWAWDRIVVRVGEGVAISHSSRVPFLLLMDQNEYIKRVFKNSNICWLVTNDKVYDDRTKLKLKK